MNLFTHCCASDTTLFASDTCIRNEVRVISECSTEFRRYGWSLGRTVKILVSSCILNNIFLFFQAGHKEMSNFASARMSLYETLDTLGVCDTAQDGLVSI